MCQMTIDVKQELNTEATVGEKRPVQKEWSGTCGNGDDSKREVPTGRLRAGETQPQAAPGPDAAAPPGGSAAQKAAQGDGEAGTGAGSGEPGEKIQRRPREGATLSERRWQPLALQLRLCRAEGRGPGTIPSSPRKLWPRLCVPSRTP